MVGGEIPKPQTLRVGKYKFGSLPMLFSDSIFDFFRALKLNKG